MFAQSVVALSWLALVSGVLTPPGFTVLEVSSCGGACPSLTPAEGRGALCARLSLF